MRVQVRVHMRVAYRLFSEKKQGYNIGIWKRNSGDHTSNDRSVKRRRARMRVGIVGGARKEVIAGRA